MAIIKLVTFDALHTLIRPRLPIFVQYRDVFNPHLGDLNADNIKRSFKIALKQLQSEKPIYEDGARGWWTEVIKRTALGAGANSQALNLSLPAIVRKLMYRFSSREGYDVFPDTLPTLRALRSAQIRTGLITNADSRILSVLLDLNVLQYLDPVVVSEKDGIEKPDPGIFQLACDRGRSAPSQTVHIGDELSCDYRGAEKSGLEALLLRRVGADAEGEHKDPDENLDGVSVVKDLTEVVDWVKTFNRHHEQY